jgi:hypothetical protein
MAFLGGFEAQKWRFGGGLRLKIVFLSVLRPKIAFLRCFEVKMVILW